MKSPQVALLAGAIASALSFNTFAGDLVSVQFSNSFSWDTHLFDSALPLFLTEREIAGGCHDHCAYSHAWRSLNNIHADHSITSMPITQ